MQIPKYIVFRVDVMRKGTSVELTNITDDVEDVILKAEQTEPQTCSFSDCDNFKNPDYARCIECKRKQIEPKTEPQTDWKDDLWAEAVQTDCNSCEHWKERKDIAVKDCERLLTNQPCEYEPDCQWK